MSGSRAGPLWGILTGRRVVRGFVLFGGLLIGGKVCCGIGSFHYSFKNHGIQCVFACDINDAARQTYEQNYGHTPLGDIEQIDPHSVPDYDILCAGFPCQAFSQCGKRKGFEGRQGNVFCEIMEHVVRKLPKVVIFENVKGLLKHDTGATLATILQELQSAGYTTEYKVFKCSDYGLPQRRERLLSPSCKLTAGLRQPW